MRDRLGKEERTHIKKILRKYWVTSAMVEMKQAGVRRMESFLFYISIPFSEEVTFKLRPLLDQEETSAIYVA